MEEIIAAHDSPIPMILAVNKADLCREKEERGLELDEWQTQEWLDEFAHDKGFIGCLRVSAKEDSNIASIFSQLVR